MKYTCYYYFYNFRKKNPDFFNKHNDFISDDSMDPSDFEYAKHNMAFDSRLEDKEVVMDMFVEDGPMAESDNPLALALSHHERQKNSRNSSNGRISEMSDQKLQYESLETTEV